MLINYTKVKWKKRTFTSENTIFGDNQVKIRKLLEEGVKLMGLKMNTPIEASPNQIFGLQEYEYRGKCYVCSFELTCFWRGEKSFNKIQGVTIIPDPKPFSCNNCEITIQREFQIWYTNTFTENEKVMEYLITVCPRCHTQQGYPYEYDLDKGIIK